MQSAISNPSTPDLAAKLAFLRDPRAYPKPTGRVEAIETHLSWVFLTDDRVYKLKKPVRHECGDLTTLEGRRHNCLEELRLNRRLAAPVYIDALPLVSRPDGKLHIGGEGIAVDWLVVMKRLPETTTLQRRIAEERVTATDIERIAILLARFYRAAAPVPVDPGAYWARLCARIERETQALTRPTLGLPAARIRSAADRARSFASNNRSLIEGRAEQSRVIEAHGDLRPEHIFLLPAPTIIDCLEFSAELRRLDPAEELAYLALECAHLGAHWIGEVLFAVYARETGDRVPDALVGFYRCGRALLRARLAIAHLDDPAVLDPDKWRRQAAGYLELAFADAAALPAEG